MNPNTIRRKVSAYSIVFVTIPRFELQFHAPKNFWIWTRKARSHFILRRWKSADFICDGTPNGKRQFL